MISNINQNNIDNSNIDTDRVDDDDEEDRWHRSRRQQQRRLISKTRTMINEDDGYTVKREDFMIRKEDMICFRQIKNIIIIFSIINIYYLYLLFNSFVLLYL